MSEARYLEGYERERLGATHLAGGSTRFLVWAPLAGTVEVRLEDGRAEKLERDDAGYHRAVVEDVRPGHRYGFSLDGGDPLPDPASRFQPQGVHGLSEVVDLPAADASWGGLALADHVIYEIHVGTFTHQGTLDAAAERLPELAALGVTAIELMPVAQFPGERNWGYDGVLLSAIQDSYGGPQAYRRFVRASHERGLAVLQDVVYNHLGPEGNVLPRYAPYFTETYATPWGQALNFDGPGSDEVRRYFVESALWFLEDLEVDGLRLDAIHGIIDPTARPFLLELSETVDALAAREGRRIHLFAETDSNDPSIVAPRDRGGLGLHAMWNDDFHHALHALLTGERDGYYVDFGDALQLVTTMREGFWFSGRPSLHLGRRHGAPADDVPGERLVVYAQNHDQVGNRPRGRRLTRLTSFEQEKLATGLTLLAPAIPLLFMGEEYAEPAPFHYFVSHTDPELIESVRAGRLAEFASFAWDVEPPDPQDEATFAASKLDWELRGAGAHRAMLELHRELLRLRREEPALANLSREHQRIELDRGVLTMRRWTPDESQEVLTLFNLTETPQARELRGGTWRIAFDSADERWEGPGSGLAGDLAPGAEVRLAPHAFAVLSRSAS